ncbi:hypothetical protein Rs2_28707 [Raphanus sativus]|nr:hypothetical protein Rs2_28707 [Raphanus sativus]
MRQTLSRARLHLEIRNINSRFQTSMLAGKPRQPPFTPDLKYLHPSSSPILPRRASPDSYRALIESRDRLQSQTLNNTAASFLRGHGRNLPAVAILESQHQLFSYHPRENKLSPRRHQLRGY